MSRRCSTSLLKLLNESVAMKSSKLGESTFNETFLVRTDEEKLKNGSKRKANGRDSRNAWRM
jgi:hypothetical protein